MRFRCVDNGDDKWNVANSGDIIKMERENTAVPYTNFKLILNDEFVLGSRYEFSVEMKIDDPVPMAISSNIVEFEEVSIPLEEHSCREAFDYWHPVRNMFDSTDNHYASAINSDFADDENDWVIIKMQSDDLFIPKKFSIKNKPEKST